jgi:competence protein ComEA
MNSREKLASVILVLTLALGTIIDITGKRSGHLIAECGSKGDSPAAAAPGPAEGSEGRAESPDPARLARDGAAGGEGSNGAGGEAAQDRSFRKIDLNAADLDQLVLLPGIGPKKAEAIIQWRSQNGPFVSIEQLLEVKGIGEGTLRRLRPYVRAGK